MGNLPIYTKSQLRNKTHLEVSRHYRTLSKLIGVRPVRKFVDKDTLIERVLQDQDLYLDDLEGENK